MHSKGRRIKGLDNRGSAMLTAIVVGVVMAVFCLTLILVTYTLYAQTAKRNEQIQCRYMAGEVAEELSKELEDHTSQLYTGLDAQVFRKKTDGTGYSGTWVAAGTNTNSQATDTIEYDMKPGSDDKLAIYTTHVSFSYTVGDTEGEDVSQRDDIEELRKRYDRMDADMSEIGEGEWDTMASQDLATGGGESTVYITVTCERGDSVCTVTREVSVSFS